MLPMATVGVDVVTVGERIKRERLKLGKSRRAFASLVGVSHVTVGNWEAGLDAPSLCHAQRLAALFKRNVRYFLVTTLLVVLVVALASDQLADALSGALT